MINFYLVFLYPILYILPAYAANGAPVIFGRGRPLDFGRKFRNRRIFGDSKSIRGTVAGILCGIIVGLIEYPFFHYMLYVSIALSLGAMCGDLIGSFTKRQLGMKPGYSVPVLDQYGFFVLALIFAFPLGHLPSVYGLLFLVILTGPLHLLTNIGANRLRLKGVPW